MASYTTNLNLKKPAGSENVAIGDINNNMDTIDNAYGTLNSKLSLVELSSGTATEVKALTTSGTYFDYTVSTSGWYTVRATTTNTSGSVLSRIAIGNTVIMNVSASLGQYDQLLPSPVFLKAGTAIKGMAVYPAGGSGSILKIE